LQIAVLLTCFNRKEKTLKCLSHLFNQDNFVDVYLVDDGSTDGTSTAILTKFSQVNIINGSGDLYWNNGMRLAWQTASAVKDYDFYIWLNDDTMLDDNAFKALFNTYNQVIKKDRNPGIITGACRSNNENNEFSYGGHTLKGAVIPNGGLQECRYINGNVVLIPQLIFKEIGNLSEEFTHAHGDFEYGIRAINAGFKCYTTREYIATCPRNEGVADWCNPEIPLNKRISLINSPLGFNVKEYSKYIKRDRGIYHSLLIYVKIYFRALFPRLYLKVKKDSTDNVSLKKS
tara:strand:- start:2381 stop:3244 length:864 start_codon:yes stop_codon:yes gene_type:complete